jgi:Aldehyde dehydrogenase family
MSSLGANPGSRPAGREPESRQDEHHSEPGDRVDPPDAPLLHRFGAPEAPRRDGRGDGRLVLTGQGGQPVRPFVANGAPAARRQRDRVEGYIAKGIDSGAKLATGGGRSKDLDRGWYVEPTVSGNGASGAM